MGGWWGGTDKLTFILNSSHRVGFEVRVEVDEMSWGLTPVELT